MTVGAVVVVVVVYGCLSVCEQTEKDFLFALESIGIYHHPRSTIISVPTSFLHLRNPFARCFYAGDHLGLISYCLARPG